MHYLTVEDFARVSIGPFTSVEEALEHYDWTKKIGDGATLLGITSVPDPSADLVLTPAEDRDEIRD